MADVARRRSPGIVALAALVLAVEVALTLPDAAFEPGVRALIRLTAQTSLAWFLLAFTASSLVALWPSPASKWLLRNRRYLGLSMAVSHTGHLIAILALGAHAGAAFWRSIAPTTLAGGGFGYLILFAMVATSTDGAQRRLGRRRWRALHLTGMWTFWVIFTSTYAPQISKQPLVALAVVPLLAAAGLRVLAATRRRARVR